MTTSQILIGVGLIMLLAVGSQVLASRLRIPAIIVLLPVGFTAGALTSDVNPERLLGASFQPLVSLSVAVILYDAGLGLDLRKLKGHIRKVVIRLIVLGVLITWVVAAALAAPLLGMSRGAAVMIGIILVVSGPTVVGPLLGFVRPAERLQRVLIWEGSLIDPVGGILGALVFHAVSASTHQGLGSQLRAISAERHGRAGRRRRRHRAALAAAAQARLGEVLGTTGQLAAVVAVAADVMLFAPIPGSSRRFSWASRSPIGGVSTSRPGAHSSRHSYSSLLACCSFPFLLLLPRSHCGTCYCHARPRRGPGHRGPARRGLRVHAENGSGER